MRDFLTELAIGIGLVVAVAFFLAVSGAALACLLQWSGAWSD